MWLKTKIGKQIHVESTQETEAWEGILVEVDAVGLTISDVEAGFTFIPYPSVFAVRVLEPV
jgi:ribosome maturation factor RimP